MVLLEARQRAIVKIDVPEGTGIEIKVGGREVPPSSVNPITGSSPFIVRRGGVHPLVSAPVAPSPVIDELARAREFVARKSGRLVTTEVQPLYACEADARELFTVHGDDLAGTQLVRAGLNNDPAVDPNNEFGAFLSDEEYDLLNRTLTGVFDEGVPRAKVEQWARESGLDSGKSPRERGRLAVQGFAQIAESREYEVTEDPRDKVKPFFTRTLEESAEPQAK